MPGPAFSSSHLSPPRNPVSSHNRSLTYLLGLSFMDAHTEAQKYLAQSHMAGGAELGLAQGWSNSGA